MSSRTNAGMPSDVLETVDRTDVGMIERCERARFAVKACEALRLPDEEARQSLDRDVASQCGIACAIDLAHPPSTQQREHAIGSELSADQRHMVNVCRLRSRAGCWCIQKILGRAVKGEQRFNVAPQGFIAAARLAHERGTVRHRLEQRRVVDLRGLLPAFGFHEACSYNLHHPTGRDARPVSPEIVVGGTQNSTPEGVNVGVQP